MHDDLLRLAAGGRLTVDLSAIQTNYRRLAALAPGAEAAAVVKADAYGLGALRVALALFKAGCRTFFVADLAEAFALRRAFPDAARIYVLNGLQPGAEAACAAQGIAPVLNSLEQARRWAFEGGARMACALQVDSGMGRLGLSAREVTALVEDGELGGRLAIDLVMSHLACADTPACPANRAQLNRFAEVSARLPHARRGLANSGGVLLGVGFQMDLVRLGVSLYGVEAAPGGPRLEPVVGLAARVIQVRDVQAGDRVGYGGDHVQMAPGQIATIALGYADGWPRRLSGRGRAFFKGVALPFAGRVSMDSITLDVSALAPLGLGLRLGDEVELLGPQQTLADVAEQADTIAYEILTRLGRRFHRTYAESCS